MKSLFILMCILLMSLLGCIKNVQSKLYDVSIITHFTVNLLNVKHMVVFGCSQKDFLQATNVFSNQNQFVQSVNLNTNYTLSEVLSRKNHARTSVMVDCSCNGSLELLGLASDHRYFNKTYQWFLWGNGKNSVEDIFTLDFQYLGPNAQITYINGSKSHHMIWDVHSKGRHLRSPLEIILTAENIIFSTHPQDTKQIIHVDILQAQGISYRSEFNGITLRGATVIDLDNITTNEQIEKLLSRPSKDSGIAAFTKYHYELLLFLRERYNFTVNFRNARGWASRLGNTKFRLGFLGIMMRNEADVGASGAFNRINRFAEFDTIFQGWKFETAFLYRFTPDLDINGKSGNFLAPFNKQVWIFVIWAILAVNSVWYLVEWMDARWHLNYQQKLLGRSEQLEKERIKNIQQNRLSETCDGSEKIGTLSKNYCSSKELESKNMMGNTTTIAELSLKIVAAVCQQGMEPIPASSPSRMIILTTFIFSLVLYNYYTSSVVGGLLASIAVGPSTVDEVVSSHLKLSFEDIGYYKVLFRENKSPTITRLINRKLLPHRGQLELPVYTHLEDAIPYLKRGEYAFHCEVVDAYPEIAKHFDANEICELRVVSGLMETELMNWILHKNSQYTEIFRTTMYWAREVGLIERLLRQRQPRKPSCQSLYTVYPVNFFGVSGAFYILLGMNIEAPIKNFDKSRMQQCN